MASDPVSEQGAAYWAGEAGWVYEIRGVPTWDVNKALEGRVPSGDGTFWGNPARGEVEYVIPAEVPVSKIVRWGIVKAAPNGALFVDWQPMGSPP